MKVDMEKLKANENKLKRLLIDSYDVRPSTAQKIVSIVEQIIELETYEYERGVENKFVNKGVEFRKGRWISIYKKVPIFNYECSECGARSILFDNYCSNCGAYMVEEDTD